MSILLPSFGSAILSQDTVLGTSEHAFDHKKMYNILNVLYYSLCMQENKHVYF